MKEDEYIMYLDKMISEIDFSDKYIVGISGQNAKITNINVFLKDELE